MAVTSRRVTRRPMVVTVRPGTVMRRTASPRVVNAPTEAPPAIAPVAEASPASARVADGPGGPNLPAPPVAEAGGDPFAPPPPDATDGRYKMLRILLVFDQAACGAEERAQASNFKNLLDIVYGNVWSVLACGSNCSG